MQRRQFLGASALFIGGVAFGAASDNRIVLGGYGPPTSSFSQGLKFIGDRLEAKFGSDVDVNYVYNILDEGYDAAGELTNLVESGELSLAYLTMFANNPALQFAALPFFFGDSVEARAAMDGELGQLAIDSIESNSNLRVLGFFENGFRHVSNNVRPIRTPDDLRGLNIRVLSVQAETFRIMGANPVTTPLVQVYDGLASGELDGQENPFENVVTYDLYKVQKYYTETAHSYLSRPIFVHGPTFDAWPDELQSEMQAAVKDAVTLQRQLHDQAEIDAAETIREAGGEIIQLTQDERAEFLIAVVPILYEAQKKYGRKFVDTITP